MAKEILYYKIATDNKTITIYYNEKLLGQFFKDCTEKNYDYLYCRSEAAQLGEREEFDKITKPLLMKLTTEPTKISNAIGVFADYFEMADEFVKRQPIFYTKQKIWWIWNFERFCYEMIDEVDLLNTIIQEFGKLRVFEQKMRTEIINVLKMRGRQNQPKDAPKHWVQFKNKIVDLKTKKVFEATSDYFITNPIPQEIGENEETPCIDKLFHEWVEEKYVQTLYEIIAYALLSDYPLADIFCLNGSGRNGKSTYLKILINFLGQENICSTSLDVLLHSRFENAKLYKKSACVLGEINQTIFSNTQLIKRLVGEDPIGYELKGKDPFDGYNYAKIIIATNKLPETPDKTVGFYSKWCIIDFSNVFMENKDVFGEIPKQEFSNLAKKSIRVLIELLERRHFTEEGTYEEREKRYEDRASPLKDFLKQYCEVDSFNEVPFWQLYELYVDYLNERKYRLASKIELSRLLNVKGYKIEKEHFMKPDGVKSTVKMVKGIGLKGVQPKDGLVVGEKEKKAVKHENPLFDENFSVVVDRIDHTA